MSHSRRRGTVLLLVVFLMLVLMGLVGLTVDLGMARATQLQLQTSADASALEGLRLRDAGTTPQLGDLDRRVAAARLASLPFDEDLDPGTPASELVLGGGPVYETGVGGIDDPQGGLLVTSGPYLPELQLNLAGNLVHGDLVAGTYEALDPVLPGSSTWHAEGFDYTRSDFVPASAVGSPSAPSFLVRHRRTHGRQPLDRVAGVSSAGPALPFLFGLGSGLLSASDPASYDPRRDGLTIRATAIADARPVLSAGFSGPGLLGLAVVGRSAVGGVLRRGLALEDRAWRGELAAGESFELRVLTDGSVEGEPTGPSVGLFGRSLPGPGPLSVGLVSDLAPQPGSVLLDPAGLTPGLHYVALYQTQSGGAELVVTGFGAVQITSTVLTADPALLVSGVKLPALVAPQNASAVPSPALDPTRLPTPDPAREALVAPVLAR